MTRMRSLLFLLAACLTLAGGARAEKADREKPVNIEADRMFYDDLRQLNIFEGNVTLTQGTLVIRANKLSVKQDPEGFQHGSAENGPGGLAYIRQKRDGLEEYIEGWGDRIEYDGKTEKADLISRARIVRGTDEARGSVISYNGRTEFYTVVGGKEACTPGERSNCRVIVRITPKGNAPDTPAKDGGGKPDLNLKSSGGIAVPRMEYPEPPKK